MKLVKGNVLDLKKEWKHGVKRKMTSQLLNTDDTTLIASRMEKLQDPVAKMCKTA